MSATCRLLRSLISHIELITFCLLSGLWLRPTPSEQHDGGNALWIAHVHGKTLAVATPINAETREKSERIPAASSAGS